MLQQQRTTEQSPTYPYKAVHTHKHRVPKTFPSWKVLRCYRALIRAASLPFSITADKSNLIYKRKSFAFLRRHLKLSQPSTKLRFAARKRAARLTLTCPEELHRKSASALAAACNAGREGGCRSRRIAARPCLCTRSWKAGVERHGSKKGEGEG